MSQRRIFISHAPTDREWVRAFAESLKAEGANVWLDQLEVPLGQPVEDELEEGFRASDVIAFVITPENARSPNLFFELGAMIAGGKRGVAIVSKDMDASEIPYPLRIRRYLLRESPKETAHKLLSETAA
jgi:TIR domain